MIVTLCGSVRFEQDFIDAQRELMLRGIACYSLAVLPSHRPKDEAWQDGAFAKTIADLVHFDKILHSDKVLVLGDGYIGLSTAREIVWAVLQRKVIVEQWELDGSRVSWDAIVDSLSESTPTTEHSYIYKEALSVMQFLSLR